MIADEEGRWLRDPGTVKLRRRVMSDTKAALTDLLGRAASSTDPSVRGAFARYDERIRLLAALGGENENTEVD